MADSDSDFVGEHETLIALCTFNESQNIDTMLTRLRDAFPAAHLLVVDDNSPDGTAQRVRERQPDDPRLELIVRQTERGLGSAIVHAMRHAVDEGFEYFLNLDADLSHDPLELPRLLDASRADRQAAVVIGSRYVEGGSIVGWPLRRRIMSKLLNRFAIFFLSLPVNDCSGSMRCYRTSALKKLDLNTLQCTGYAVLEELLVKINRLGGKMIEVPITFTERQHGESKLTLKEAARSVRFMFHLAWTARGN